MGSRDFSEKRSAQGFDFLNFTISPLPKKIFLNIFHTNNISKAFSHAHSIFKTFFLSMFPLTTWGEKESENLKSILNLDQGNYKLLFFPPK